MNSSYNLSGFIDLLSTSDEQQVTYKHETSTTPVADTRANSRDEMIDNFLFSSVLTDINYTD